MYWSTDTIFPGVKSSACNNPGAVSFEYFACVPVCAPLSYWQEVQRSPTVSWQCAQLFVGI
eukprot:2549015-Ditylum_brightwellii.AAC.2